MLGGEVQRLKAKLELARAALERCGQDTMHRHHQVPRPKWCELCYRAQVANDALEKVR